MSDRHPKTFSGAPTRSNQKGGLLGRLPSYTLIYIPSESGASRKLSVPKAVVFMSILALFALCGAVAALGVSCLRMKGMMSEYDKLRAENHSIRSEAAALVAKLQEVQSNLQRVDTFSDQVREVALDVKPTPGAGNKAIPIGKKNQRFSKPKNEKATGDSAAQPPRKQGKIESLPTNVGPLTPEEYELSKQQGLISDSQVPSSVKFDSLEFKDLFVKLSDIKDKSSSQLHTLETLLGELQTYRTRIAATPTISPVKGWVSSLFGLRASPINGQSRMHQGLDIAAPMGTPIRTAADGTVTKVATAEDYGIYVEVTHGHGVVSRYAHASKISVKPGTKVKKGDQIGNVGMTGRTTGPHLHYELVIHGRKVDPSNFIAR